MMNEWLNLALVYLCIFFRFRVLWEEHSFFNAIWEVGAVIRQEMDSSVFVLSMEVKC